MWKCHKLKTGQSGAHCPRDFYQFINISNINVISYYISLLYKFTIILLYVHGSYTHI
jgi:hypothetical protein